MNEKGSQEETKGHRAVAGEYDGTAEIYTYNTKLKKRLTAYAATYPNLCQLIEEDENGGLRFEIDKHRISIRLTAPYSQERKAAAQRQAKESILRIRNPTQ